MSLKRDYRSTPGEHEHLKVYPRHRPDPQLGGGPVRMRGDRAAGLQPGPEERDHELRHQGELQGGPGDQ